MRISSLEDMYFRRLFGSLYDHRMKAVREVVQSEDVGHACVTILICTVPISLFFCVLYNTFDIVEKFAGRHNTVMWWLFIILVIIPFVRFALSLMETDEDLKKYDSLLNDFLKAVNFMNRDNPETHEQFRRIREEMIQAIDLGGATALESLIQSRFAHDLIEWITGIEANAEGICNCGVLKEHMMAIEDLRRIISFSKALGIDISRAERFLKEHTIEYNIPRDEEYILEYP